MPVVPAFSVPTLTNVSGQTPLSNPPPPSNIMTGSRYFNTADGRHWIAIPNPGPFNPATPGKPTHVWREISGSQGVPVWTGVEAYNLGDLVRYNGTLYLAKQGIGPAQLPPDVPGSAWTKVGSSGSVTIDNTPGNTPATAPTAPGVEGAFFINRPDGKAWVAALGGGGAAATTLGWEPLPSAGHVYRTSFPGDQPGSPGVIPAGVTPQVGDVVINTGDNLEWIFGPDAAGTGTAWIPLAGAQVFRSDTPSQTPASTPPTNPHEGDIFLNSVDRLSWVYGPDGSPAGTLGWVPLSPGAPNVFISGTAGELPAANAAVTAAGAAGTLTEGDEFINQADKKAYVYAPDPAGGPGTYKWVELPAENTAIATNTAGEVPEGAGAGQTNHTFTVPPKIGDIFTNTTDSKTWVRVDDPNAPGTPIWQLLPSGNDGLWIDEWAAGNYDQGEFTIFNNQLYWAQVDTSSTPGADTDWQLIGGLTVTTTTTRSDTPTSVPPANPKTGDVFINQTDNKGWIAQVATGAVTWQLLPSGSRSYFGRGAMAAPFTQANNWGMPAGTLPDPQTVEPNTGDLFFDTMNTAVMELT